MIPLVPGVDPSRPLSILCLGAHSDDIEIGCGGTLIRLLGERPGSDVRWVVFSADERRAGEARASVGAFTADAGTVEVAVLDFRESYFPFEGAAIKDSIAELADSAEPDVVFTHRGDDEHQDHRTIGQLTWNHFRDHLIAEYEIPKYEGDLGRPNLYVPLDRDVADRKVGLLLEHFASQHDKPWFTEHTFRGLMALRAVECNSSSGAAEAFHVRKAVL